VGFKQQRRGGFSELPFDPFRIVFLLGAAAGQIFQFVRAIGRGRTGQRRLEQPLRNEIGKSRP